MVPLVYRVEMSPSWECAVMPDDDTWELFKAGRALALEDDPLADAHAALLRAIAELRAIGVAVPISLHQAVHALTYARARR